MLRLDTPLIIDSDNALGSHSGDIDDGFALALLMKSGARIECITATSGNTSLSLAHRNTAALAKLCGFGGNIVASAGAVPAIASLGSRTRFLALGPLTHLAQAIRENPSVPVNEILWVGTNFHHRFPAIRFFDFNHACDWAAATLVFESSIPLTLVPCDVARRLRLRESDLRNITGALGGYLRTHSRRWFRRALRLKLTKSVPVWDLVAATYMVRPDLFTVIKSRAKLGRLHSLVQTPRGRPLKIVTDFDPKQIWCFFLETLNR